MTAADKNIKTSITGAPPEIIEWLEACYKKEYCNNREFFLLYANTHARLNEKSIQWFIKRCIDIIGTSLGIIAISPLLLLIALAIKLESPGPVFFKQKRIGKNGREFYMYKFRSMYKDAEQRLGDLIKQNETNECMFKLFDDPRITKVGKFLRKHSFDELAQLINVLRGEMSLVGFRPPIPRELDRYKEWHYVRFSGMPGLTGPWQVSGRSKIKDFDRVVELEFDYVRDWNYLKDIFILFKTLPVVLFGKDAA